MVLDQYWTRLAVLLLVAFVPSVIYTIWIRNTEIYGREPWSRIGYAFMWGAIAAVAISIVLEMLVMALYGQTLERQYQLLSENPSAEVLVAACIVAPIVEEGAKAMGVRRRRNDITSIEDGLIYGAACGLGFAATENLLYEGFALLEGGVLAFIALAVVRSISSSLLHASATATSGYGISKKLTGIGTSALPYFLLAVLMHGLFNLLASLSLIMEGLPLLGFVLAVAISWLSIRAIRRKIMELDHG